MKITTHGRNASRRAAALLTTVPRDGGGHDAVLLVDALDLHEVGRPAARLHVTASEAAELGARLLAFAAAEAPGDALRALGFAQVGDVWSLDLADGTVLLAAGIDENDEPCAPTMDGPAFVHRLADPMDHATMIAAVECRSLRSALTYARALIDTAGGIEANAESAVAS